MLALLLFLAAPASAATQFTGVFTQQIAVKTQMSEIDCKDLEGRYEAGFCYSKDESSVQVNPDEKHVHYLVHFNIIGTGNNSCDGIEVPMKARGEILVPLTSVPGASNAYKLNIRYTDKGIQVKEVLGPKEKAANRSPGCRANAFFTGTGEEFLRLKRDETSAH
ncbi:MAG: hypothetical protein ACXWQO_18350 [Bdellovibrionota bacterium]